MLSCEKGATPVELLFSEVFTLTGGVIVVLWVDKSLPPSKLRNVFNAKAKAAFLSSGNVVFLGLERC